MKKTAKKLVITLAAVLTSAAAHAESNSSDPLKYATLGLWADAPLGVAARVGIAIPTGDGTAFTIGNEFGLNGNKQFVGYRAAVKGHGVVFGAVDLARWKTRSHPWLADADTEYYGAEAQLLIFRAGLMFPKGDGHSPKLTFGAGFGF